MAQYTMTLPEVMEVTNGKLFDPTLPYRDYANLQRKIIDHFVDREIAFDTAELFKYKLNAALRLRVHNYNDMFDSQLIQFDPFVTDYMVTEGKEMSHGHEKRHAIENEQIQDNISVFNAGSTTSEENHQGGATAAHYKENAGVGIGAKLTSESENSQKDTDGTKNVVINETTDNTVNKTVEKHTDKTDNQTGRQWTEKGNSQGHNLDVHSDTPEAMLFNQPPHIAVYGTGRSHNHGKVTQDEEGNDVVSDFPETQLSAVDAQGYEMGSEDTPWYNYASSADNKTGHDTYSKEGTETYNRSGTETGNESENETGNKTIDRTEDTEYNETEENSRALNANEHTKTDTKEQESFQEDTTNQHNTSINGTSENRQASQKDNNRARQNTEGLHRDDARDTSETRKGRVMQSPSKLLQEYRDTMLFNADMWLFGELEPLFMQLF